MENLDLSDAELALVAAASHEGESNFTRWQGVDMSGAVIRAEVLRRLLMGLPLQPGGSPVRLCGTGIHLRHATIRDILHLEFGCQADGSALPRLALEACLIEEPINLRQATIRHLSLTNSQISKLDADHIHILGRLDISGVRANPDSAQPGAPEGRQPLCHVSLRGAHIEDGIEAAYAYLVGPPKKENYRRYSERSNYALDLAEAHVNSDIRLFPDFTACGGVNINGSTINGSFHAHGAHFTREQMYALDATGAHIHGNLALDSRNVSQNEREAGKNRRTGSINFTATGQLRLHNCFIEEDLRLDGAQINGGIRGENITVNGDVAMCAFDDGLIQFPSTDEGEPEFRYHIFRFMCKRRIDLRGAQIGGDLSFRGAWIGDALEDHEADAANALDISSSTIGGHALFSPHGHKEKELDRRLKNPQLLERFESEGIICIDGTEIKGDLTFKGARIKKALRARAMTVHGLGLFNVYECEQKDSGQPVLSFEAGDSVVLDQSVFSLRVNFSGAQLHGELLAPDIQVGGRLLMCANTPGAGPEKLIWFHARKRVVLSGATIKGDFDLTGALLNRGLRFRGGRVESAMIIDVDDGFYDDENGVQQKSSIDLFNAHANLLSDHSNTADLQLGYGQGFFLRLEGFTYSRFRHHADNESLAQDEVDRRKKLQERLMEARGVPPGTVISEDHSLRKWLKQRLNWLSQQYRTDNQATERNYNPDPYNTLYKFYKRMGAQTLADKVLLHKLHIERIVGKKSERILFRPFEAFGYGLKPLRALQWFVIFVGTLSVLVYLADLSAEHRLGLYLSSKAPIAVAVRQKALSWTESENLPVFIKRLPAMEFEINWPIVARTSTTGAGGTCGHGPLGAVSYAFETTIPSFDLNERKTCDFGHDSGWIFRTLKLMFNILGWVLTSLTVLTWTGLFRRNAEP